MKYFQLFLLFISSYLFTFCSEDEVQSVKTEIKIDSSKKTSTHQIDSSEIVTKEELEVSPAYDTLFFLYPIALEEIKIEDMVIGIEEKSDTGKLIYEVSYLNIISNNQAANLILQELQNVYFGDDYHYSIQDNINSKKEIIIEEYNSVVKEANQPFNWEYSLSSEVIYNKNNLLTIKIEEYSYKGTAHGNSIVTFLTFDTKTGKKLTFDDLIKCQDCLMKEVKEKLAEYQEAHDGSPKVWEENLDLTPKHYFFDDSTFYVWYEPYEIAAYVFGRTELKIPMYSFFNEPIIFYTKSDVFKKILPPQKIINISNDLDLLKYEYSFFRKKLNIDGEETESENLKADRFENWFKNTSFEDTICKQPMDPGRHFNNLDCILYDSKNKIVFDDEFNYLIGYFTPVFNENIYPKMKKEEVIKLLGAPLINEKNVLQYSVEYNEENQVDSAGLIFLFSEEDELLVVRYIPKESYFEWNGIEY